MTLPMPQSTAIDVAQAVKDRAAVIAALPRDDVSAMLSTVGADDAVVRLMLGGLDGLLFPVLARMRGLTADVALDPDVWESAVAHEVPLLVDRATVEEWAEDFIPRERFDRLRDALPHSSVPEAVATITAALIDHE